MPFNTRAKWASVVYHCDNDYCSGPVLFAQGAPGRVAEKCNRMITKAGETKNLDLKAVHELVTSMVSNDHLVAACAYKPLDASHYSPGFEYTVENLLHTKDWILIGLVALSRANALVDRTVKYMKEIYISD